MRAFWLQLRNSPIRWAVPALVALDLAALFLRNRYWIGVWPEAGAAAQVPTYLLGPVVAGTAAWSAAAPVRYGLAEQLTAARVHRAIAEAHRLGATVVLRITPYLVGQAVAFALTARTFPPGLSLWAGYFAHGAFVTLLTVALGMGHRKVLQVGLRGADGDTFLFALHHGGGPVVGFQRDVGPACS